MKLPDRPVQHRHQLHRQHVLAALQRAPRTRASWRVVDQVGWVGEVGSAGVDDVCGAELGLAPRPVEHRDGEAVVKQARVNALERGVAGVQHNVLIHDVAEASLQGVEEGGGDGQVEEIKAGTFPGREGEAKGKSGEKITRDATTLR